MNQEILQAYLRQEETPAYIFDLDMLKSRVRMMKSNIGRTGRNLFCNESQSISDRPLKDTADKFEVCSRENFTFVRQ